MISIKFKSIFNSLAKRRDKTKKFKKSDLEIKTKADGSVVTKFDLISDKILKKSLPKKLIMDNIEYDINYFSEETIVPYNIRSKWIFYWSVDPLDGTSDYIKGGIYYTINIALIYQKTPIIGFIYLPFFTMLLFNNLNESCLINKLPDFISDMEEIDNLKITDKKKITSLIQYYYGDTKFNVDEFDISALHAILIKLGHNLFYKNRQCTYNKKNYNYTDISIVYNK